MIQKFKIIFQVSQPTNIPQKCFSTQNGSLDVRFQMRLNPNHVGFSIIGKIKQKPDHNLLNCFKKFHHGVCLISPDIRSLIGLGLSHLKPDIKRYVLDGETFYRDICGLRYWKINTEFFTNL